jgi:hypothetical protein
VPIPIELLIVISLGVGMLWVAILQFRRAILDLGHSARPDRGSPQV